MTTLHLLYTDPWPSFFFTELDLSPNYESFPNNIWDGCGMPTGNAYFSCSLETSDTLYRLDITPVCDFIIGLNIFYWIRHFISPNIGFHRASATGVDMPTGDAYSSGHLVPSHLGLTYVPLVDTNSFPELVIIFSDYAIRTSLCTFSVLLLFLKSFLSPSSCFSDISTSHFNSLNTLFGQVHVPLIRINHPKRADISRWWVIIMQNESCRYYYNTLKSVQMTSLASCDPNCDHN